MQTLYINYRKHCMDFSITFLEVLFWGVYLIAPVLIMLSFIIIVLGLIVGRIESWSRFEALYWAFITALTVGYGDIRPLHKLSRVLSTVIAIFGIMVAGIVVAITVEATSVAFEKHIRPNALEHISGDAQRNVQQITENDAVSLQRVK